MSTNIRVTKICQHCGSEFIAKTLTTKFCSHLCNSRNYKARAKEKKVADYEEKVKVAETEFKITTAKPALNEKEYFSISDAAVFIGVSKRTIERLIATNQIKVTRLNRRVIIPKRNISKLFEG
jgi:excisionase family DNA binding protein